MEDELDQGHGIEDAGLKQVGVDGLDADRHLIEEELLDRVNGVLLDRRAPGVRNALAAGDQLRDGIDGAERIGADFFNRQAQPEMLLHVEKQLNHVAGIQDACLKEILTG